MEPATLLWDGDCGFCARAVDRWTRGADPSRLRAVAFQSDEGQKLVAAHDLSETVKQTAVVIRGDRLFTRSSCVVAALRAGGRPVRAGLLWLVPRPLRHAGYDWVARNRSRL